MQALFVQTDREKHSIRRSRVGETRKRERKREREREGGGEGEGEEKVAALPKPRG